MIVFVDDESLEDSQLPPEIRDQFRVSSYQKVIESLQAQNELRRDTGNPYRPKRIPGLRLFQHPEYYPVDLEPGTDRPLPNRERFALAIDYLLDQKDDQLAATDLAYLRVDNLPHDSDLVLPSHKSRFADLVARYGLRPFLEDFACEKERVFKDYRRIVEDIGGTFRGTHFEILLHDVRNPFRSVIAARNSEAVSGRVVGDPSTRFVVNYVKNQGEDILALEEGSKVAYLKHFAPGADVKATTSPVFDDIYGLVGVLCCNIDVGAIDALSPDGRDLLLASLCANSGLTPEFEKRTSRLP